MMGVTKITYLSLVLLAGLMVACSSEPANTNSAGNGAPQPTGASQPAPASPAAPGDSRQALAPPAAGGVTAKPADSAVASNGKAAGGKAPKFVVPVMKLDFGTQKKDKTLARSIVVKNEGNAELKIESVEPS
jgi:hypothetical protein